MKKKRNSFKHDIVKVTTCITDNNGKYVLDSFIQYIRINVPKAKPC